MSTVSGSTKRRPPHLPAHGALYLLLAEQSRHDANDFRVAGLVMMLRHRGLIAQRQLNTIRNFTDGFSTPEAAVTHAVEDIVRRMFGEDSAMREVAWFELEILCAGIHGLMHRVGGRDLRRMLERELRTILQPKLDAEQVKKYHHLRLAYLKR